MIDRIKIGIFCLNLPTQITYCIIILINPAADMHVTQIIVAIAIGYSYHEILSQTANPDCLLHHFDKLVDMHVVQIIVAIEYTYN